MPPVGGWKTGVYCIRNLKNGKVYVGSASLSFTVRTGYHRGRLNKGKHENTYLQRAWDKYGRESFMFRILERCSPSSCLAREQYWMDTFRSYERSHGYNICPIAGSVLGTKWTPERRAIGISQESRDKQSATRKGRKLSPESIEKRTLKLTGMKRSEETKQRMREAAIKRGISAETRLKMNKTRATETYRSQASQRATGHKASDEAKRNMSEAQRRRFAKEKERDKIAKSLKGNNNRSKGHVSAR